MKKVALFTIIILIILTALIAKNQILARKYNFDSGCWLCRYAIEQNEYFSNAIINKEQSVSYIRSFNTRIVERVPIKLFILDSDRSELIDQKIKICKNNIEATTEKCIEMIDAQRTQKSLVWTEDDKLLLLTAEATKDSAYRKRLHIVDFDESSIVEIDAEVSESGTGVFAGESISKKYKDNLSDQLFFSPNYDSESLWITPNSFDQFEGRLYMKSSTYKK